MSFIRAAFSHFLNISYKIIISSFFLKLFGGKRLVKSVKVLPGSLK